MTMETPIAPSRIQTATFRLVAHCLKQLRSRQLECKRDSEILNSSVLSRRNTNVLRDPFYFYQTLYEIHT